MFFIFPRSLLADYKINGHIPENYSLKRHSKDIAKLKILLEINQKEITYTKINSCLIKEELFCFVSDTNQFLIFHLCSCLNLLGKGHFPTVHWNNRVRIRNFATLLHTWNQIYLVFFFKSLSSILIKTKLY